MCQNCTAPAAAHTLSEMYGIERLSWGRVLQQMLALVAYLQLRRWPSRLAVTERKGCPYANGSCPSLHPCLLVANVRCLLECCRCVSQRVTERRGYRLLTRCMLDSTHTNSHRRTISIKLTQKLNDSGAICIPSALAGANACGTLAMSPYGHGSKSDWR